MYKDANYYTLVKRKRVGKPVYCYYCYTPEGKRVLRGTGARTRAEAIEVINKRILEGKLVYPDGMMIRQDSTKKGTDYFKDYFRDFYDRDKCPMLAERKARGRTLAGMTIECKRSILTKHLIPAFGDIRLCNLDSYTIDKWLIGEANKGSEKSSLNQRLTTLKTILDFAVTHGEISVNPASVVKPLKAEKSSRRAFTDEEIKILFSNEWSNEMVRIMCLVSAVTGMRIGEVRALRPEKIMDGYIMVDSSYSESDGLKGTKTGNSRMVPIPKRVEELLLSIGDINGYIFAGTSGKPINTRTINITLDKHIKKCGLDKEGLCFHSFRHYANTKLVAADINAEKIRASIGHTSEAMTEHYLHLEAKDMQEIASVGDKLLDTIMQ